MSEEKGYDAILAMEEASRCLLCYDAPCSKACPANSDPAKFIRSIRFQNYKGAAESLRLNNPLAGVCARVCPIEKLCASGCVRAGLDKPINIGKLQRFLTDFEESVKQKVYEPVKLDKTRVAIIGSGPSGISCANILARNGYQVTIFERRSKVGGYLTYGIPPFRLPNKVVENEIKKTLDLGVKVVYNSELGTNISFDSLMIEGFKAIVLATGYEEANILNMFKDNPYVESAIDFLARLKLQEGKTPLPEDILVIGGGDVAMDVISSAKLLGVNKVTAVARENMEEFPASSKELIDALSLNARVIPGFTPISVDGSKVTFEDVLGHGNMTITASKIILATGQISKNYSEELVKERNDYIVKKYMTSEEGVFATGDIVCGDKTVVEAVKKGKECAESVMSYLKSEGK